LPSGYCFADTYAVGSRYVAIGDGHKSEPLIAPAWRTVFRPIASKLILESGDKNGHYFNVNAPHGSLPLLVKGTKGGFSALHERRSGDRPAGLVKVKRGELTSMIWIFAAPAAVNHRTSLRVEEVDHRQSREARFIDRQRGSHLGPGCVRRSVPIFSACHIN